MLEWAPLCKFWCHKNTFANQFDRLSISSIESSWSRHCRNFVQGLQPRKVHEKGAKIFGQLTILDSSCMQLESSTDIQSPCTDMVGPEQKKCNSCDSNPHFTNERFSAPGTPPRITSWFQILGSIVFVKSLLWATLAKIGSALHASASCLSCLSCLSSTLG